MIHEVMCPNGPIMDKENFNMTFVLKCVGVIRFVNHVLQLLPIRFTQQNCVVLAYYIQWNINL